MTKKVSLNVNGNDMILTSGMEIKQLNTEAERVVACIFDDGNGKLDSNELSDAEEYVGGVFKVEVSKKGEVTYYEKKEKSDSNYESRLNLLCCSQQKEPVYVRVEKCEFNIEMQRVLSGTTYEYEKKDNVIARKKIHEFTDNKEVNTCYTNYDGDTLRIDKAKYSNGMLKEESTRVFDEGKGNVYRNRKNYRNDFEYYNRDEEFYPKTNENYTVSRTEIIYPANMNEGEAKKVLEESDKAVKKRE